MCTTYTFQNTFWNILTMSALSQEMSGEDMNPSAMNNIHIQLALDYFALNPSLVNSSVGNLSLKHLS